MDVAQLVTTVSAAAGSAVVVAESARRYWTRREARQAVRFRRSVQEIVDISVADVIRRQTDFERRQGAHLDRQDRVLDHLRRMVEQNSHGGQAHGPA
jgi:hypothetical protein